MPTTESPIVVGVFRDHTLAEQAIDELRHAGFRDDEIRLAGQTARAGGLLDHLASTLVRHEAADGRLPDELVSKGIPRDEADYYQQQVEAGRTVLMVESYGHQQQARDILHHFGAYDVNSRPVQPDGDRIIPVREEELPPVSRRWQIRYHASLERFESRANFYEVRGGVATAESAVGAAAGLRNV